MKKLNLLTRYHTAGNKNLQENQNS